MIFLDMLQWCHIVAMVSISITIIVVVIKDESGFDVVHYEQNWCPSADADPRVTRE